jgi:hypothetical protein
MPDLDIRCEPTAGGFGCDVTVRDDGGATAHRVTFAEAEVVRLLPGQPATPDAAESLARETFRFLLEREPKESIMRAFGLSDVKRYFPEFEGEIRLDPGG